MSILAAAAAAAAAAPLPANSVETIVVWILDALLAELARYATNMVVLAFVEAAAPGSTELLPAIRAVTNRATDVTLIHVDNYVNTETERWFGVSQEPTIITYDNNHEVGRLAGGTITVVKQWLESWLFS